MAITKVIKDLTELNPGNPDYVLNATNAVTVINAGGNQYNFNGVYGKFGLRIGTTVLTGVPSGHPFAVLNNGLTGITYTGTVNEGTLAVGGFTYTFYSGDITITVTADFGVASYYCKIHGYMGGENNFVSVYSEAGLKMPSSNAAYSGPTVAEGMMRNEVGQVSESSASTMQHYNGTDWKNFVNVAIPPATYNIDFLAAAGGGGGSTGYGDGSGGLGGAGGGAGGLRSSFGSTGGLCSPESALTLTTGVTYTVTVGPPGAGGSGGGFTGVGGDGSDSVISGTGITTITALKGGRGGSRSILGTGGNGTYGSGGGNCTDSQAAGGFNVGTTCQGFASGGTQSASSTRASAGGGGAGSTGIQPTSASGGNGGNSILNSITGSGVTYAGGGGGGATTGGSGGASNMSSGSTGGNAISNGSVGTINTGAAGGGGGAGNGYGNGAQGGSGVVVLRLSTSDYSGTTTGSPNVDQSTVSGVTILKFTGSGSYTA